MKQKRQQFKQRYQKSEILGEGSYGKVFKAFDKINNEFVAIKKMRCDDNEDSIPSTTLREISILKKIKHPNIVNLIDYYIFPKKTYLIFEYLIYDLRKFIDSSKIQFSLETIKNIIRQILEGVYFCHSQGILHRDLKPQNILISFDQKVKIADFGLARQYHFSLEKMDLSQNVATLWYRSPEILLGEQNYGFCLDIWSLGCIFIELIQKRPLFIGDCQIDQIFKIFQFHGTPINGKLTEYDLYKKDFPKFVPNKDQFYQKLYYCSKNLIDFSEKILDINPDTRINAQDALDHPFLKI